jgi:DNA-binding NarL/FixJ family response regulator
VFLVDDHEVVRAGLRSMLEANGDMVIVGEAGTARAALERVFDARPDVAVLDLRLPDGSGVEVCREIRSNMPDVACLVLTSYDDDQALFDSIMAGAAGYVLKQLRGVDIVDSIRQVAQGHSLLDPSLTNAVFDRIRGAMPDDELSGLSAQEKRVLSLIGEGLTNRQIADSMGLAEKTVKNYVSHLLAKLGMKRRTQAAVLAARRAEKEQSGAA